MNTFNESQQANRDRPNKALGVKEHNLTRYEALSRLAAAHVMETVKRKRLFEQVASDLRSALISYLDAPIDSITFRELDRNLELATEDDGTPHAKVRRARDNKWYFALCLHLETRESHAFSKATLKFAAREGDATRQIIEFDRDWEVEAGEQTSFSEVAAYIASDLESDYKKPYGAPTKRIGF